jgi:hypothetical protein
VPISRSVSPVKEAAGGIIGASKIDRDISERQHLADDVGVVRFRIARRSTWSRDVGDPNPALRVAGSATAARLARPPLHTFNVSTIQIDRRNRRRDDRSRIP